MPRFPIAWAARGIGSLIVNDRAGAVGPVGRGDRAVHGVDETARDRQPEAGSGAHPVALLRPVELVEDMLQVAGRDAVALIEYLQVDGLALAPRLDADRRVRPERISPHCRAG